MNNNNIKYIKPIKEFIEESISDVESIVSCLRTSNNEYNKSSKEENSWRNTLPILGHQLDKIDSNEDIIKNSYVILELKVQNPEKNSTQRVDVVIVSFDSNNKLRISIIELKGWSGTYIGFNDVDKLKEFHSNLNNPNSLIKEFRFDDENIKIYPNNVSYPVKNHPVKEALVYKELIDRYLSNKEATPFDSFESRAVAFLPNINIDLAKDPLYHFYSYLVNNKNNNNLNHNYYTSRTTTEFNNSLISFHSNSKSIQDINKLKFLDNVEFKSFQFSEYLDKINKDPNSDYNILFGSQVAIKDLITEKINLLSNNKLDKRQVILIKGDPGSGKSLIALETLRHILIKNKNLVNDVSLIVPGPELRANIKELFKDSFKEISNNINGVNFKTNKRILIVDEAHKAYAQDKVEVGLRRLAPCIELLIMFHDDFQVINKKSISSNELIEKFNIDEWDIHNLEIQENFRTNSNPNYTPWLKSLIYNDSSLYNIEELGRPEYDFKVYEDKNKFVQDYYKDFENFHTRMCSFWVYRWEYEKLDNEGLPIKNIDIGDYKFAWNPNEAWLNKVKKSTNAKDSITDKTKDLVFNQSFLSKENRKSKDYIGYFNTVQGAEFEYVYVYIPKLFFVNDNGEIDVNLEEIKKEDGSFSKEMQSQFWSTKSIKGNMDKNNRDRLNKLYLKNRLLVLLTRGVKGVRVYCEDEFLFACE